jgi:BolA protein
MGPFESKVVDKLTARLQPAHLEVKNESPMHGLPPEAEKHFRVVAVSGEFTGLSRIERHRLVQDILADEIRAHIHALSLQAFTPEEWKGKSFDSPECLGGGKKHGMK